VPEEVLRRQHEQAVQALPLLVEEGFTDVRIVGPSGVDAACGGSQMALRAVQRGRVPPAVPWVA
jgi:hypothetical protein